MSDNHVFLAINEITGELSKEGIEKNRTNKDQHYQFRGIDDIYNSLSSLLAKYKLCIIPKVLNRECSERQTSSGKPLFCVVVYMEFQFVSAIDNSSITVSVFGEAMDLADKATNKAMSAAYKYACLQTFCIPTEGENDADAVTHMIAPPVIGKGEISVLQAQLDTLNKGAAELVSFLKGKGIEIESLSQLPKERFDFVTKQLDRWIQGQGNKDAD